MKQCITFFLCLLLLTGYSQQYTYVLGTEYQLPNGSQHLGYFDSEEHGIVSLAWQSDDLHFATFDPKTLRLKKTSKVEIEHINRHISFY